MMPLMCRLGDVMPTEFISKEHREKPGALFVLLSFISKQAKVLMLYK
ncbi:hypothetical protein LC2W_1128 [Lacticaseibacillus paracasei]|jgi:hypothetical protein|nr:hypothetical protein LC2W_1128 [Lacticaseibacillus paracasei]EPC32962.1 hypothetical protein Lpp223_1886 [Lacticaseibacillus paracasei subsp. paracasei Lpp223]KTE99044.1 hypothetical protein AC564_1193c [Lacticaseibacillus paracasei]